MQELSGKIAIITGAGRGIGRSIALRLAALGAETILLSRTGAELDTVAAEIAANGGKALALPVDLLDPARIETAALRIQKQYGRLDILINSAGIGGFGQLLHEMPIESFDRIVALNLRAPFLTMKAFVPQIIATGGGHIVNISSLAGKNPLAKGAAYAASKWGLNGLTYSVAEELREYGIRVTAVAPGSVATSFGGGKKAPEKKLKPEDVAHAVAMIVTEGTNSFVSEILLRPLTK